MIETCMALWNRLTGGSGVKIGLACAFLTSMFFGVTLVIVYSVLSWQSAVPSQASSQNSGIVQLTHTSVVSPDPAVTVILTPNSADPIRPGIPAPVVAPTPAANPVLIGGYAAADQPVMTYPSASVPYYPQQSTVSTRSSAAVSSRSTHSVQPSSTPVPVKSTPTVPVATPTPVVPVTTPTPTVPVVTPTVTPPTVTPTPVPVAPTAVPIESTPLPQPRSTVLPIPVMTPTPSVSVAATDSDVVSSSQIDTQAVKK